jgi:membrane fusion protein, multidrug efflux system
MRRGYLYFLSTLFFVLELLACSNPSSIGSPGAATGNSNLDTVPIFLLTKAKVEKFTELPAELLPLQQTELFAKVPGYVKEMKVDIGDAVHKGQVLCIIEAPEVDSKYMEYQNALSAAKARYAASADNYRRLYNAAQAKTPGIVAPVDLERNRQQMLADSAEYFSAQKLAESYQDLSGYLTLRAPYDGVVILRKADPGELVSATSPVLVVQDNSILRLRVAVPELYTSSGSNADSLYFRIDAMPESRFLAILTRKSESIDPVTRTEIWEYDFKNLGHALKPGAFAYAQFHIARPTDSYVVPASSIVTNQEKKFVIRVRENKVQWVEVRQGIMMDKGVEIFGNLSVHDSLVSVATDERKPGSEAIWKLAAKK